MRRVDIAHSGQTVPEAMAQLEAEIKSARRDGVTALVVVHGFGASGVGGAIKEAVATELPGLARRYGFKAYGNADKERIPREQVIDSRSLNPGSTLLVFRESKSARESKQDFRPNFRNLRSKVKVNARAATTTKAAGSCQHVERQLVSRGPRASTYRCRHCGKTFMVAGKG